MREGAFCSTHAPRNKVVRIYVRVGEHISCSEPAHSPTLAHRDLSSIVYFNQCLVLLVHCRRQNSTLLARAAFSIAHCWWTWRLRSYTLTEHACLHPCTYRSYKKCEDNVCHVCDLVLRWIHKTQTRCEIWKLLQCAWLLRIVDAWMFKKCPFKVKHWRSMRCFIFTHCQRPWCTILYIVENTKMSYDV